MSNIYDTINEIQSKYIPFLNPNKNLINRKVDDLVQYLAYNKKDTLVLGISGGIDSTVCGKLSQLVINEYQKINPNAKFIALKLPYNRQRDADDVQLALNYINPDIILDINIGSSVDEIVHSIQSPYTKSENFSATNISDFNVGNIKARVRMIMQYAIAAQTNGIVIGTDNLSEKVIGFFTLHGDGAYDYGLIEEFTKRQVKQLATLLGVPELLYNKVPTADLETDNPGLPDEEAFGFTYDQLDDLLECKYVDYAIAQKIVARYNATRFKRR